MKLWQTPVMLGYEDFWNVSTLIQTFEDFCRSAHSQLCTVCKWSPPALTVVRSSKFVVKTDMRERERGFSAHAFIKVTHQPLHILTSPYTLERSIGDKYSNPKLSPIRRANTFWQHPGLLVPGGWRLWTSVEFIPWKDQQKKAVERC